MYSLADTNTSLTTPSALNLTLRLPAMFSWQPIPGENWLMTHRHSLMLTSSMLLLFREWHKWVILYILVCWHCSLCIMFSTFCVKSSPNNPVLVTISLLFYIAGKNLICFLWCLFVGAGLKNREKKTNWSFQQYEFFRNRLHTGIKLTNSDEGNWVKAWEICIMSCSLEHSSCSSRMGRAWTPM